MARLIIKKPTFRLQEYGKFDINRDKHMIEVIVNFDNLTMSYVMNDIDYGTAYNIKKGEYKLMVSLYQGKVNWRLSNKSN